MTRELASLEPEAALRDGVSFGSESATRTPSPDWGEEGGVPADAILAESGDAILLEDGTTLLAE